MKSLKSNNTSVIFNLDFNSMNVMI